MDGDLYSTLVNTLYTVSAMLPYGSSNVEFAKPEAQARVDAARVERVLSQNTTCRSDVGEVRMIADTARKYKAGNCSEMSALAFILLHDQGVRPVEWMGIYLDHPKAFKYLPYDPDHVFVVVGRTDPSSCDGWVVDPHMSHVPVMQRVFDFNEASQRMRGIDGVQFAPYVRVT